MKTILITGAANGLGRELLTRAAAQGDNVIGLDRVELRDRPNGTRFIQCDLRKTEEMQKAVADICAGNRALDLLVNNAAIGTVAPLEHLDANWIADCVSV